MRISTLVLAFVAAAAFPATDAPGEARSPGCGGPTDRPAAPAAQVRVPLHFEENAGQHHAAARFVARPRGFLAWFAEGEVVVDAQDDLRMRLGSRGVAPVAGARLAGSSHYLRGRDPSRWVTGAPHRADVTYPQVVPGVDVTWRSSADARLEYVLTAAPGSDPERFEFEFDGARAVSVTREGELVVETARGEVRHGRPSAWQDVPAGRRPVTCRFEVRGAARAGFRVGPRDASRPLVIDPTVTWATRYGGTSGTGDVRDLAVDASGAAYVLGETTAADFPCVGGAQSALAAAGQQDGFVFKIDGPGTAVVYATYFGGTAKEEPQAVALDASGAVYAAGVTESSDFPVASAFQQAAGGARDAFVLKLDPSGASIAYATYLGGTADDSAFALAVDPSGAAHVGGQTTSTDFPTASAFQAQAGSTVGTGFVAKLSASGDALAYSTYLGGSVGAWVKGIAVDSSGRACVGGYTSSTNFPVTTGAAQTSLGGLYDGFAARFSADGSALEWSTYLGGTGHDYAFDLALDPGDAVVLCGRTGSGDFPVTAGAVQTGQVGITSDGFVAKLRSDGSSVEWSTYLGGSGTDTLHDVAAALDGSVWVVGYTTSSDLPTVDAVTTQQERGWSAQVSADGARLRTCSYATNAGLGLEPPMAVAVGDLHGTYVAGRADADFQTTAPLSETGHVYVMRTRPAPPPAPTGLSATAVSDRRVALAWTDTSPELCRFELERTPSGGAAVAAGRTAHGATSHTDSGLAGDTDHDYRVRAVNDGGASEWSSPVRVMTGPAAPTGVAAARLTNTRVAISWTDRSGRETSYQIERKIGAAAAWTSLGSAPADATAHVDPAAPAETLVRYRVRSGHASAPSEWSDEAAVTTGPADPGARPPMNLPGGGPVAVAWIDRSSVETGYEVERAPGWPGTVWTTIAVLPPGSASFEDATAAPESVWSYRVRAVGEAGPSEWVVLGSLTTAPWAPTDLAVAAATATRVTLSWTDRSRSEVAYEVRRDEQGTLLPVADLPANSSGLTERSLVQDTEYAYRVRAVSPHGQSAWSEVVARTPSGLVVRSAKISRGKAPKPRPTVFTLAGEFDAGGAGIDFAGETRVTVGAAEFLVSGAVPRRGGWFHAGDEISFEVTPSRGGGSRVAFALTLTGAAADALPDEGEVLVRYRNGEFDATGVVALAGGAYAIGRGRPVDPALAVNSIEATVRGKGRDSLSVSAWFDASGGPGAAPPDVVVRFGAFEFRAAGADFRASGTKLTYSASATVGGARILRKVVLDHAKGTVRVTIHGADLGRFGPGAVPVDVALEVGPEKCCDTVVAVCSGKKVRY